MDEFLSYCRSLEAEQRVSCRAMYLWNQARGASGMPALGQIGFLQAADLRDNLFVVAIGNGGGRFLVRRTCRLLDQLHGGDPLGVPLIDALPSPLDRLGAECCEHAVLARQPQFDAGVLELAEDVEIRYRLAFMPLSANGQLIDHLLGAISFRMNRD
jgi:hypothetical protein